MVQITSFPSCSSLCSQGTKKYLKAVCYISLSPSIAISATWQAKLVFVYSSIAIYYTIC